MQIVELELSHFTFYCPVTGRQICGAEVGMDESVPSLMGFWEDEFLHKPIINNPELKIDWDKYYKSTDRRELSDGFEKFLRSISAPQWLVYKITTYGMACGPMSSTVWFVINMELGAYDYLNTTMLEEESHYWFRFFEQDSDELEMINGFSELKEYLNTKDKGIESAAIILVDSKVLSLKSMGIDFLDTERIELSDKDNIYAKVWPGVCLVGQTKEKCKSLAKKLNQRIIYWLEFGQTINISIEDVNSDLGVSYSFPEELE